jgi:membrane protein required for colicin V production
MTTEIHGLLNLNVTDYIIVAVVLVSTLISLVRGFLKELMSLVIWFLGFWVAIKFYESFAVVLTPYIANVVFRQMASFAGIFFLILIFGMLFNYLLAFIVSKSGLSGTDRLLGMVFGCARGILLMAVVLLLISATSFIQDEWWKKSVLIPHLQVLVDWLRVFLPQKMTSIAGVIQQ